MDPNVIVPVFYLVSGLLVAAGVAKVLRPRSTAQALYTAGLPGSDVAARALGAVEIVVGTWALVRPTPAVAIAVAVLYLGFGAFVTFLLLAYPEASSCGCAGSRDAPPTFQHVALNVAAAAVALVAASVGTPSIAEAFDDLGLAVLPAAAGLVSAGWLLAVIVAELPAAIRTWTPPRHHDGPGDADPDRHRRADVALTMAGIGPDHASLWPDHDPATGIPLTGEGTDDVSR
jgi:hypothetical protein